MQNKCVNEMINIKIDMSMSIKSQAILYSLFLIKYSGQFGKETPSNFIRDGPSESFFQKSSRKSESLVFHFFQFSKKVRVSSLFIFSNRVKSLFEKIRFPKIESFSDFKILIIRVFLSFLCSKSAAMYEFQKWS